MYKYIYILYRIFTYVAIKYTHQYFGVLYILVGDINPSEEYELVSWGGMTFPTEWKVISKCSKYESSDDELPS